MAPLNFLLNRSWLRSFPNRSLAV